MLWIIFATLAVLAATFMALPLRFRAQTVSDRNEGSVSILADQLREVETDAERGLISEGDARAAQIEIKRRLLALSRRGPPAILRQSVRKGHGVLWAAAIAVPLAAGALYAQLGSPEIPGIAFAERQDERDEQAQITALIGRLEQRLQDDPAGGPTEGWMLLGQTYMRMGYYGDAAAAIENVIDRADATSPVLSQYAEALVASEDGIVTPNARAAIARARKMDSSNPAAAYYEAIALDQAGDSTEAHNLLLARLDDATGSESWVELFVAQANRIGETLGREPISLASFAPIVDEHIPGPTAVDIAAAGDMSEADRSAFIQTMVDRLANRLTETPEDLDGWMRLASAYSVLGDVGNARNAYRTAERLAESLPTDDQRRQTIRQALSELD
ncbi:c-type cytochrome biogenesis protein CcmI [Rhodobacteraceae bacterium LMO-12]|nr:c-type cytochrome biogenesis protein CcmI [Rhodobacteraceae bacterium LMO-JJ12]